MDIDLPKAFPKAPPEFMGACLIEVEPERRYDTDGRFWLERQAGYTYDPTKAHLFSAEEARKWTTEEGGYPVKAHTVYLELAHRVGEMGDRIHEAEANLPQILL